MTKNKIITSVAAVAIVSGAALSAHQILQEKIFYSVKAEAFDEACYSNSGGLSFCTTSINVPKNSTNNPLSPEAPLVTTMKPYFPANYEIRYDQDACAPILMTNPTKGSVTYNNGSDVFSYSPNTNYVGDDMFNTCVSVFDGNGEYVRSVTGRVKIIVQDTQPPVDNPPQNTIQDLEVTITKNKQDSEIKVGEEVEVTLNIKNPNGESIEDVLSQAKIDTSKYTIVDNSWQLITGGGNGREVTKSGNDTIKVIADEMNANETIKVKFVIKATSLGTSDVSVTSNFDGGQAVTSKLTITPQQTTTNPGNTNNGSNGGSTGGSTGGTTGSTNGGSSNGGTSGGTNTSNTTTNNGTTGSNTNTSTNQTNQQPSGGNVQSNSQGNTSTLPLPQVLGVSETVGQNNTIRSGGWSVGKIIGGVAIVVVSIIGVSIAAIKPSKKEQRNEESEY